MFESGQPVICVVDVSITDDDGRSPISAGLRGASGEAYFDDEDEGFDLVWFLPDDTRLWRRPSSKDKIRGAFYIPRVWVMPVSSHYRVKWQ